MATTVETVTVTIPKTLAAEATRLAEESGRDVQGVSEELLEEGVRMRRVPGIVFTDGAVARFGGPATIDPRRAWQPTEGR